MKFTMTKIAAAAALAFVSSGALAAPETFAKPGNFTMYDPTGAVVGNYNDITGWVDSDAMTFGVASTSTFFGLTWTASGGTLFLPGTYNISTADPAPGASGGVYSNVVVGANQIGGNIKFAWGATTGIDVVLVWDLVPTDTPNIFDWVWVSSDIDGDGIPGIGMIDGPFPGFSANFNFPAIPEASTYAMMLAGLGLVGVAAARRRRFAAV